MSKNAAANPAVSAGEVAKLAGLARIRLAPGDETALAADMEHILDYVRQIQGLSVGGSNEIISLNNSKQLPTNVMREDGQPHPAGAFSEDLLVAVPVRQSQYVKVKKIL